MPRGNIYYCEVTVSYRSGRYKDRKKAKIKMSFVGYDLDDACKRLKKNTDKMISVLTRKVTGSKVRDVVFIRAELLHESGKTMYDIDTNKAI
tara:strand:+ start:72 stop:347 length:276 start_codon:yes stop_codon:yes gene_type:complete